MQAFTTLFWIEFQRLKNLGLAMLIGLVGFYLLALQTLNRESGTDFTSVFYLAISIAVAFCFVVALLFIQARSFGTEYGAGRWPLLLGSPQPGWLHLGTRLLASMLLFTLFTAVYSSIFSFWIGASSASLNSLWLHLWAYLLGGANFIVPTLFIGLFSAIYLPRKASVIAFFVGWLGTSTVIGLFLSAWGRLGLDLGDWKLPEIATSPGLSRLYSGTGISALPMEGFVLPSLISVALFVLASYIWQEAEV
jgi:hypothetical protein